MTRPIVSLIVPAANHGCFNCIRSAMCFSRPSCTLHGHRCDIYSEGKNVSVQTA